MSRFRVRVDGTAGAPRRVQRALGFGLSVVALAGLSAIDAPSIVHSDPTGPVRPVVVGDHLVDSRTGSTWVPHGVNWPNLEYACVQGWTPSHAAIETQRMAEWGVDVVRLPLNQDCWLGVDGAPAAGSGTAAAYQSRVQARVDAIHAEGMVAILDLHWTGPAGVLAKGQRSMADAESVTFWAEVATAYRDDPSVMFELFNEPYSRGANGLSWSCWADGGCQVPIEPDSVDDDDLSGATFTVAGMSSLVAAVRAKGAVQPLLLGGLNYSNDLTGWLAHAPDDDQLVAAWHNYPGQGCWTACWNSTIVDVAAEVPVLMTEFGYLASEPGAFGPTMDWADAHGIGYLPWAWWVTPDDGSSSAFYALVSGPAFTPKEPAGVQFHDHLATLVTVAPTTTTTPIAPGQSGPVVQLSGPAAATAAAVRLPSPSAAVDADRRIVAG